MSDVKNRLENIIEQAEKENEKNRNDLVDLVENILTHLENFKNSIEANVDRLEDNDGYDIEEFCFDVVTITDSFKSVGSDMNKRLKEEITNKFKTDGLEHGLKNFRDQVVNDNENEEVQNSDDEEGETE